MAKYHDEFDIEDSASEMSGSGSIGGTESFGGHEDEETGKPAESEDSEPRQPEFSYVPKSMPPLEPPFASTKNQRSTTTMTTYAVNDSGEDFGAEMEEQVPYKGDGSRMSKWLLIVALLLLLVAAIVALIAVMGGEEANGSPATSVVSNGNSNTGPKPTPAPTPATVEAPAPGPSRPIPSPTRVTEMPVPTPPPVVTPAPTSEIYGYIKARLPDGGFSLDIADSYQSLALKFVEETYKPEEHDIQRVVQRFVLACIRLATNKQENAWLRIPENSFSYEWKTATGWLLDENECLWYGIECNDEGRVTAIDLSSNWLTGTFPPETALLKGSLKILALRDAMSYNYGDDGLSWIGELTLLEELDISEAVFQYDGIPPSFAKLTNMKELDVSYTLMHGQLRGAIFDDMQQLEYLYIGGNSYNASLPSSITNLTRLKYFYADNCDLEGDLSAWSNPKGTPDLVELWIYENPKMSGQIPTELGQYPALASLALSDLNLNGSIPSQMGDLLNMEQMWLNGNFLSGKIPSELGKLSQLKILELYGNDLTGDMPTELCDNVASTQITYMWADCTVPESGVAEVTCDSQCCACCGDDCDAASTKTNGGNRRRLLNVPSSPEEARRQIRHQERRERRLKQNQDPALSHANAARREARISNARKLSESRRKTTESKSAV